MTIFEHKKKEARTANKEVYMPKGFQWVFKQCSPLKLSSWWTENYSAIPYVTYTHRYLAFWPCSQIPKFSLTSIKI